MRTFTTSLVFVALTFSSASAAECVPTTSEPELTFPSESGGTRYIDNDPCVFVDPSQPPGLEIGHYWVWIHGTVEVRCLFSIWSYSEQNGIPGLQRGDEVHDDTCGGMIESDSLDPY